MKIFVKAKTGAKENKINPPIQRLLEVDQREDDYYTVFVKELPIQGRANDAILKIIAEYFKIPKSNVRLVSGAISKRKVFDVNI